MTFSVISWPSQPALTPTNQLVMLHGFGSNAENLAGLAPALNLTGYQFQFLNAPFPHPQVPGGSMWYDLFDENYTGLTESRQGLQAYLDTLPQETGIPLSQTVLAGFSQGGAMALDVGRDLPLAGLLIFSGYLHPLPTENEGQNWPPIFMVHGSQDTVVAPEIARQAAQTLTEAGGTLAYHELEMGHDISPEAMHLAKAWLQDLRLMP